jgi:Ran GTPase-activating protein (RanGAP) involved in mRNA processing and transport
MLASKSPLSALSLKFFNMQNFGAQILAESMYRSSGSIISLNLESNAIGVAGAEAIATFIILQTQDAKRFGNKCLRVLKLANNKISNEGATAIADALSTNTSLEEVTLKNNGISHGLVAIGKALERNNTLGKISLFGNDFDMESGKIFSDLQTSRFSYLNVSIDIQVYVIDDKYMVAEKSG